MRRGLLLAAFALAAVLVAPGAEAHYNTARLGYRSKVVAVKPAIPGVRLRVLFGDDQISLNNGSGKTIVIEGYNGEPYLRFSRDGIYVNNNSPSVYLNLDRYAKTKPPKSANPNARPKWEKLISGHIWAWHDHRAHWMSTIPPPQISAAPRKPHHIWNWKVPATANGKRFFIDGSLDYVPPPKKSFPVTLAIVLASVIGVGMVGLFALRRVILRSLD